MLMEQKNWLCNILLLHCNIWFPLSTYDSYLIGRNAKCTLLQFMQWPCIKAFSGICNNFIVTYIAKWCNHNFIMQFRSTQSDNPLIIHRSDVYKVFLTRAVNRIIFHIDSTTSTLKGKWFFKLGFHYIR